METNRKIEADTPNLLVRYRELVNSAVKKAVHEALSKHKQAGNPIAVYRDGKVVILQPDEI